MKVLFVATVQSHIGQFHMPFIRCLKEHGHTVEVACKDNRKQKPGLDYSGIDKFYNVPFERSPYKASNIKAYKQLKKIINEGNYDIIHCHTPVAGILTRLAGKQARKKSTKVFYTAHGFHFYKGAPKKNWILYYPTEKYCAKYTDILFTMNNEDYEFAKKHLPAKKVEYIPGVGIDIDKFANAKCNVSEKRKELGIPKDAYLIMSVGELNKNKNYKIVLDSIAQLNDPNIYYCIVGVGPLKTELEDYAKSLNLQNNFKLLGYRRDLPQLYKTCNLVIQPSIREGLPLTVMEAMASKTPIIASNIRGCKDLISSINLFSTKNLKDLIAKIKYELKPNKRIQGRNFNFIKKFSIQNVNNKYLKFYYK